MHPRESWALILAIALFAALTECRDSKSNGKNAMTKRRNENVPLEEEQRGNGDEDTGKRRGMYRVSPLLIDSVGLTWILSVPLPT